MLDLHSKSIHVLRHVHHFYLSFPFPNTVVNITPSRGRYHRHASKRSKPLPMAVVVSFCVANWCGKALSGVDTYQSRWGGNGGKWGFSSMAGWCEQPSTNSLFGHHDHQPHSFPMTGPSFSCLDLQHHIGFLLPSTLPEKGAILRLSKGKCWWNRNKSWWTKLCTKLDDQNTEFNGLMYVYLLYNLSRIWYTLLFSNSGQDNLWASLFVRPINQGL